MKGDAGFVEVAGVVTDVRERPMRGGRSFVQGSVRDRGDTVVRVNWWGPEEAPERGVRVHVRDRLETYRGEWQVQADATEPLFDGPPEDALGARVG